MKNVYMTPEFQIFFISAKDVIAASGEAVKIIDNNEIGVDAGFIF